MQTIQIVFAMVITFCITPVFIGLERMFSFQLFKSKFSQKQKKTLFIVIRIITIIIPLFLVGACYVVLKKYANSKLMDYICVLIYTALLAIYSNNKLYISPQESIETPKDAFREGFTRGNLNNIFSEFPLRTLINLAYLAILVCAQIEELQLCTFSTEWSYFFTLNKYGLIVLFATEKIIAGFKPDAKRAKIMMDKWREKTEEEKEELEQKRKKRQERKQIKVKQKENSSTEKN